MIKHALMAMAALGFVLAGSAAFAGFREGIPLEANGQVIDVEVGHLVPCVLDWNGDGKKDLMAGQFNDGRIRMYLNEGSDAAPEFGSFEYLEAGGQLIRLSAG